MNFGYARVSTSEQETTMQLDALQRAGVDPANITHEKRSGVKARPKLHALIRKLKPGDKLHVYKIDRLARSLLDLLGILAKIETAKATFASCTEPIDTSTAAGKMMMHMIGAFAEFERTIIRERCMAGQRAAMERGIHCGRRRTLDKDTEHELVQIYLHSEPKKTMRELSITYGVSESVVKRAVYRVINPESSALK